MSDMIDIEAIYRQERQRWFREEAPRRSLRDVIAGSVPYWIILVALVLYVRVQTEARGMPQLSREEGRRRIPSSVG